MSEISYLSINNAHNGIIIKIPKPVRFHTLSEFKKYIQQSYLIDSVDNLFLLTTFGIKLNYNLINEIGEVFVYDKRLFTNIVDQSLIDQYTQSTFRVSEPTHSPLLKSNLGFLKQNLSSNLKINQGWARIITQDGELMDQYCRELIQQINVIFKCLNTIFQFATNFTNEIEKNFSNFFNYVKLINYKTLHKSWITNYKNLKTFPTFKIDNENIKLSDFLEVDRLQSSADYIEKFLPLIVNKLNELKQVIETVNEEKLTVDKFIETSRNESISNFKNVNILNVLNQLQTESQQLTDDIENLHYKNMDEIYRLHRDKLSISIYNNAKDIYKNLNDLQQFKNKLTKTSLKAFNTIANLQMKMVGVKTEMKKITTEDETATEDSKVGDVNYKTISNVKKYEDYLSLTIDLPLIFGFSLIEKRRQFEWYDFYSKGIVNNVSEQLSTIIEHEKVFRGIWLKKFGTLLSLINDDPLTPSLPNIDVTLVGNRQNNFSILYDLKIERDDIINYISLIETTNMSKNFVTLLNKNFKDLIASTNNMKKVTKVISSLSTYTTNSADDKLKSSHEEGTEEEIDFDLNLIKGLKSRIKKLENLLHQQQFKNLNNWPVIRNVPSMTNDNRQSTIIQPTVVSPARTNPTQLLLRNPSTTKENTTTNIHNNHQQSEVLDSSVIDKHLDNIRLKKLNNELQTKNTELTNQINSKNETIIQQQKEMEHMKLETEKRVDELMKKLQEKYEECQLLKQENKIKHDEVENLTKKLELSDNHNKELEAKITEYTQKATSTTKEVADLNKTVSNLRSELGDAMHMKNDLLSNLSSKEAEFTKERNQFNNDLKALQLKLDEVNEDYENLMELTQAKQKKHDLIINDLNNVIINLMNDIKKTLLSVFEYFLEYCLVLESMGLLLVKEDEIYKIKRVKGLKSKKSIGDGDMLIISNGTPSSKVIEEIENEINIVNNIPPISSILPDSYSSGTESDSVVDRYNDQSMKLISTFNQLFKFNNENENENRIDHILNTLAFKNNVQLQEDSINDTRFFLNAISKRFRDVEGFAKRQAKDNKLKEQEHRKLVHRLNSKISVNGFQEKDLVLFLPTRIDRPNGENIPSNDKIQPWAAFNIGAPHYFLKTEQTKNKEWIIGRVKKITEYKVTEENVQSLESNPFQLSVNVTWYLVEADEE